MTRKALLTTVSFILAGLVHTATAYTPPPFAGPGVETQTGQALYQLPRDHAWHGGAFYQTNDYNEWHYITALGRDVETGDRISVFWVPLSQGWMEEDARPLHNVLFAFHNLDTGEFHTSMPYLTGPLNTEGTIQLREGNPDGPIVATGFTEMIMLTDPYEDGTDPSYGPPASRSLPEDPELPWTPWQPDSQD